MSDAVGRLSDCTRCGTPGAETIVGSFQVCQRCDKEQKTPDGTSFDSPRIRYDGHNFYIGRAYNGVITAKYTCQRCNRDGIYPVDVVANGGTCSQLGSPVPVVCNGPLLATAPITVSWVTP